MMPFLLSWFWSSSIIFHLGSLWDSQSLLLKCSIFLSKFLIKLNFGFLGPLVFDFRVNFNQTLLALHSAVGRMAMTSFSWLKFFSKLFVQQSDKPKTEVQKVHYFVCNIQFRPLGMLRIVSRSAMGAPRGKARGAPFPVFSRSRRRRENDVYHQRLYQKLVLIKEKPTGKILSR